MTDEPRWRQRQRKREERDAREAQLYRERGGKGCAGGGERRIRMYFLVCGLLAFVIIVGASLTMCGT